MKKKLVGLVLGVLALVSMVSLAQAGTTGAGPTFKNEVIATTACVQAISVVTINDSRQEMFAMKSVGVEGGGSGNAMAKVGTGTTWKSASDSGPLQKVSSIMIDARYTITMQPILSPSFASATSMSPPPDRDLLATSFTGHTISAIYSEKTRSSHVPSAGIKTALEPNDYGWREARST